MRALVTALMICITTVSYAKDVFRDKDLKNIHVSEVKNGVAVVVSGRNSKAEVAVGDCIGRSRAEVLNIQPAFITLVTGTSRMRIPVTSGEDRFPRR